MDSRSIDHTSLGKVGIPDLTGSGLAGLSALFAGGIGLGYGGPTVQEKRRSSLTKAQAEKRRAKNKAARKARRN